MSPDNVTYDWVRNLSDARDGDVIFYEGTGPLRWLYKITHAEFLQWDYDPYGNRETLMVVGYKEGVGCRKVTFSSQVRKYSGKVSIYRMRCDEHTARGAARLMRNKSGKPYGWFVILLALLWHFMFFRWLLRIADGEDDITKPDEWNAYQVCSSGIVDCVRRQMGVKRISEWPMTNLPSWLCFPQRCANDTFFYPLYKNVIR